MTRRGQGRKWKRWRASSGLDVDVCLSVYFICACGIGIKEEGRGQDKEGSAEEVDMCHRRLGNVRVDAWERGISGYPKLLSNVGTHCGSHLCGPEHRLVSSCVFTKETHHACYCVHASEEEQDDKVERCRLRSGEELGRTKLECLRDCVDMHNDRRQTGEGVGGGEWKMKAVHVFG